MIDRQKIYQKYYGHCAYCGKKIKFENMQVDHIYPKRRGGSDKWENANPSCRRCNHYKRSLLLEGFREQMKTLHERIRNIYIVKVALDYGIIEIKEWDGIFYFEKCCD